jgi:hypothetical protein
MPFDAAERFWARTTLRPWMNPNPQKKQSAGKEGSSGRPMQVKKPIHELSQPLTTQK